MIVPFPLAWRQSPMALETAPRPQLYGGFGCCGFFDCCFPHVFINLRPKSYCVWPCRPDPRQWQRHVLVPPPVPPPPIPTSQQLGVQSPESQSGTQPQMATFLLNFWDVFNTLLYPLLNLALMKSLLWTKVCPQDMQRVCFLPFLGPQHPHPEKEGTGPEDVKGPLVHPESYYSFSPEPLQHFMTHTQWFSLQRLAGLVW